MLQLQKIYNFVRLYETTEATSAFKINYFRWGLLSRVTMLLKYLRLHPFVNANDTIFI